MRFIKQSQTDETGTRVPRRRTVVDVSDFGRRPYGGSVSYEDLQRDLSKPEIDHRHRSEIAREEREKREEKARERKKQEALKRVRDRIKYIKDMDLDYDFMVTYAIREGVIDALADAGVDFFDRETENKDKTEKIYNNKAISEYVNISDITVEAAEIISNFRRELNDMLQNNEVGYIKTDEDIKRIAREEGRKMGERAMNIATSPNPMDIDSTEGDNERTASRSSRMRAILKIARIAFRR